VVVGHHLLLVYGAYNTTTSVLRRKQKKSFREKVVTSGDYSKKGPPSINKPLGKIGKKILNFAWIVKRGAQ